MLREVTHGPVTRIHMARTAFGRPLFTVNAYLVADVLVDAGCPATARELLAWCRRRSIRLVVNTHHHEDHSGADALLSSELGLPVQAPARSVPILAEFDHIPLYRRVVWGRPTPFTPEPLPDVVEAGPYRLECIAFPGHSEDLVCLWEPNEGWLFAGDLFIRERVRYLRADEDACGVIASLRRALELRPRVLFCAHAGMVVDACAAIERKIAYWERIADRARALRDEGHPVREITRRLLGPEGWMTTVSRGEFSKGNLIRSLLRNGR
jgi:glyoxylase-like metal-dependent hydrolase (beta-lactamase superfamily II)